MSNGNIKTKIAKIPIEWDKLISDTIRKIGEKGYKQKVYSPEIIRLLIHFNPARQHLNKALELIMEGFNGIDRVSPEVEKWMKGYCQPVIMEVEHEK